MASFHYVNPRGETRGPVTADALRELRREGVLGDGTAVWAPQLGADGVSGAWRALREVPLEAAQPSAKLSSRAPTPPPVPASLSAESGGSAHGGAGSAAAAAAAAPKEGDGGGGGGSSLVERVADALSSGARSLKEARLKRTEERQSAQVEDIISKLGKLDEILTELDVQDAARRGLSADDAPTPAAGVLGGVGALLGWRARAPTDGADDDEAGAGEAAAGAGAGGAAAPPPVPPRLTATGAPTGDGGGHSWRARLRPRAPAFASALASRAKAACASAHARASAVHVPSAHRLRALPFLARNLTLLTCALTAWSAVLTLVFYGCVAEASGAFFACVGCAALEYVLALEAGPHSAAEARRALDARAARGQRRAAAAAARRSGGGGWCGCADAWAARHAHLPPPSGPVRPTHAWALLGLGAPFGLRNWVRTHPPQYWAKGSAAGDETEPLTEGGAGGSSFRTPDASRRASGASGGGGGGARGGAAAGGRRGGGDLEGGGGRGGGGGGVGGGAAMMRRRSSGAIVADAVAADASARVRLARSVSHGLGAVLHALAPPAGSSALTKVCVRSRAQWPLKACATGYYATTLLAQPCPVPLRFGGAMLLLCAALQLGAALAAPPDARAWALHPAAAGGGGGGAGRGASAAAGAPSAAPGPEGGGGYSARQLRALRRKASGWYSQHVRSDRLPRRVWVSLYTAAVLLLFAEAAWRHGQSAKALTRWYPLAKGFGQLCNLHCTLLLLPVLRSAAAALHSAAAYLPTRLGALVPRLIPLDKNIVAHQALAKYGLCASVLGHASCHYANYAFASSYFKAGVTPSGDATVLAYSARVWLGLSGHLLLGVMLLLFAAAAENVKRCHYETFWLCHHLFVPFFALLLSHGSAFYLWASGPLSLYAAERLFRQFLRGRRPVALLSVAWYYSDAPAHAAHADGGGGGRAEAPKRGVLGWLAPGRGGAAADGAGGAAAPRGGAPKAGARTAPAPRGAAGAEEGAGPAAAAQQGGGASWRLFGGGGADGAGGAASKPAAPTPAERGAPPIGGGGGGAVARPLRSARQPAVFTLRFDNRRGVGGSPVRACMDYLEGQYLYLCCPAVSRWEWHPFTIASSPQDDFVEINIRVVPDAASWTWRVCAHLSLLNPRQRPAVELGTRSTAADGAMHFGTVWGPDGRRLFRLDGPYGAPSQAFLTYRSVLCIGAGIGVTPFASILQGTVMHRWMLGFQPYHVHFVWVARLQDVTAFRWLLLRLPHLKARQLAHSELYGADAASAHKRAELQRRARALDAERARLLGALRSGTAVDVEQARGRVRALDAEAAEITAAVAASNDAERALDISIYLTGTTAEALDARGGAAGGAAGGSAELWSVLREMQAVTDPRTGEPYVRVHAGRPDWAREFGRVKERFGGRPIGVIFCGAAGIGQTLKHACVQHSDEASGTVFRLHKENF